MLQKQVFLMLVCGTAVASLFLLTGCGEQKAKTTAKTDKSVVAVKSGKVQAKPIAALSNIAVNPSFEEGEIFNSGLYKKGKSSIKKPIGWTTKGQILNNFTGWVSDEAHTGKRSLKIENIGGTNAYWQGGPIIFKEPTNAFKISIWTKTKEIKKKSKKSKFQLSFNVYLKGDNNKEVMTKLVIDIPQTNHDWTKTESKALFTAKIIKVVPNLSFSGMVGTAWFDDMNLVADNIFSKDNVIFDSNTKATFTKNAKLLSEKNNEKIYQVSGNQTIFSSDFIPVKRDKIYKLYGMFGSKGEKPSKLYFGYSAYTKDKKFISRISVNYVKNTETKLLKKCVKGDSVLYIVNGKNWISHGNIAFGVDSSGKYADLPNFNLSSTITNISNDGKSWEIKLSKPISKDYPAGTNIREHVIRGTYIYNVAESKSIPHDWIECSGVILGDKGDYSGIDKLYPRTGYVKILMLMNYKQPKEIIQFKNIKLQESD
jgi:hypothetical protein